MISYYIDPGTGSMLFSIVIGLATALYFVERTNELKPSGGKAAKKNHLSIITQLLGIKCVQACKDEL